MIETMKRIDLSHPFPNPFVPIGYFSSSPNLELDTPNLLDKLNALEQTLQSLVPGGAVTQITESKPQFVLDGQGCIDQLHECDNSHRDATYFTNIPKRSINGRENEGNDGYYVVYG